MPRPVSGWRALAVWLVVGLPSTVLADDPLVIDPTRVTSLAVAWAFHAGDDPRWAAPEFDDTEWQRRPLRSGFERKETPDGFAWYRRTIDLSPHRSMSEIERAGLHLGVTVGKIDSAYELYAGGLWVGGVGELPPEPRVNYDRHDVYRVPYDAIDADGRLVLALRVWASPSSPRAVGPREGPFFVGPAETLVRQELASELQTLFFSGWFVLLGLIHLELYRRRRKLTGYLWFALLSILFGLYSFLRTQWKYALGIDFVILKSIEHLTLYLDTALLVQLLWPLLGLRIGPILRSVQVVCLVAGSIAFVTPGLGVELVILPFWQLLVIGIIVAGTWQVFASAWRKLPESRILAVGSIAAASIFIYDMAVDRYWITGPRLSAVGFAIFITSLALTLAHRFVRLHAEVEALRRSEEANRVKSDFLANMSHELRTPITGILGSADLLRQVDLPERATDYAEIIRSSARTLLAIVDDVLDFSKVEAGHLELEDVEFPPRETVQGVVDLLTPRARAKDLTLDIEIDPRTPLRVEGDPLRLRQVLLNLVGNAIKFTQHGGVRVGVERLATASGRARLRFSVRDSGIGIDTADLERLFLPFTQADSSTTRRFGGTGLGLAISRRIVEAMGGRLTAHSQPDQGSTFSFELELTVVEASVATTAQETPSATAVLHPTAARRILLVEDNPINHLVVEEQLVSLGHQVTSAYDGREALDLIEHEAFDLVLMDCQMPVLDGYETTRRIRQAEVGDRHVPIVALTAHALAGDREKCLAAGMDDYLAKPFTTDQLAILLEPWLDTET